MKRGSAKGILSYNRESTTTTSAASGLQPTYEPLNTLNETQSNNTVIQRSLDRSPAPPVYTPPTPIYQRFNHMIRTPNNNNNQDKLINPLPTSSLSTHQLDFTRSFLKNCNNHNNNNIIDSTNNNDIIEQKSKHTNNYMIRNNDEDIILEESDMITPPKSSTTINTIMNNIMKNNNGMSFMNNIMLNQRFNDNIKREETIQNNSTTSIPLITPPKSIPMNITTPPNSIKINTSLNNNGITPNRSNNIFNTKINTSSSTGSNINLSNIKVTTNTPTITNTTTTKTPSSMNNNQPNLINVMNSASIFNKSISTGKTPKATQLNSDTTFIALTENKSREIGYASYNNLTGEIEIGQFCDSQTYVHLYTKLYIQNISMIITPPLGERSELLKMVTLKFPNVALNIIPRKLFNENNGLILIRQYSVPDKLNQLEKHITTNYLCCSAFNALVKYLDSASEIGFTNNCLKIKYSGSERTMSIDAETIKNLELIRNNSNGTRDSTLFSILNHTKTPQGERLLIGNIVQPPNDLETILQRHNAIKFILEHEREFFSITPILSKMGDLDKMLVKFSHKFDAKKLNIKKIQSYINNIIQFKNTLELIPKLLNIISNLDNPLLQAICKSLSNQSIEKVKEETLLYINDQPNLSKSNTSNNIVHSIKQGVNGLLDVCKKTFNETIQDINNLYTYYQEEYKLPQLKIQQSMGKGFHLSLPCKQKQSLPPIFIGQVFKNGKCNFVTDDLLSLSRRNKEVFEEIILMTSIMVEKLMDFYRTYISDLFNCSQSIALLDLLMSLCTYVTLNDNCFCPEFYQNGPLAIKKGNHPLLHFKFKKSTTNDFVPNDTLITETSNFQIIHGPNMSGKSTYIQQVALLTIMSHIGSYVPAQFMSTPIFNSIISRIGTSDCMQSNSSTFMTEMKEISFILECANDKSLVIVDELGRGTSNIDGSSLAYAISEKISQMGCFTLFITHYQELLSLTRLYPNIRNYHLNVSRENDQLKSLFQLSEGRSQISHYGIDIAEIAGINEQVIKEAINIRNQIDLNDNESGNGGENDSEHPSKQAFQLVQKLLYIEYSKLNSEQIIEYIQQLKEYYSITHSNE